MGEPTGKRVDHEDGLPADVPIMDMPNEPARHEMGDPMKWRVYEAGLKGPEEEPVYEPPPSMLKSVLFVDDEDDDGCEWEDEGRAMGCEEVSVEAIT